MKPVLQGVRVLDLTQIRAGPKAARLLADAGAEVIKVESLKRPDGRGARNIYGGPSRVGPIPEAEQRAYNRTGFDQLHRNKLGLSLDLTAPDGIAIFKRLVAVSDVVMENFSVGVMNRLGLGYQELCQVRPDIIMLSMPAFGANGPEKDYIGFGWGQDNMAGFSAVAGYRGGPPMKVGTLIGDPLNGVHGAAAIMTALVQRALTGKGQMIDFSQLESLLALRGDSLLDYAANGRIPERMSNRHPVWAPQGVYRCRDEDTWVAIAVTSEAEWEALCRAIGRPELLEDARFATVLARRRNHDELDKVLEAWTGQHTHFEAMESLQKHGVRAGAVLDQNESLMSPHSEARGFLASLTHPDDAFHFYINAPWRFSKSPSGVRTQAPLMGEHTRRILGEVLGLPPEELDRLEHSGVTANFLSPAPPD